MPENIFSNIDVLSAYKKLKHYFYYDNTSLFIRKRIAEFEKAIELEVTAEKSYNEVLDEKLTLIAANISNRHMLWWRQQFQTLISYKVTPKSFFKAPVPLLTNRSQEKNLKLQRVNIFIDAHIEVHIISVLWLMYVGRHLSKWVDKSNYAYHLELTGSDDDHKVVNGLRLYTPYFSQYQNWRDNAIKKSEELLKEKKDVVILSLDIKDYFHSVKINLKSIKEELFQKKPSLIEDSKINKLFVLLHEANKSYTKKLQGIKSLPALASNETILPIGLLSSGLLGNLYLRDFDKEVKDKINPAYYGRYVDDLLFVISDAEVKHNALSPVNYFIDKYFIDRELLAFSDAKAVPPDFLRKEKINREGEKFTKYKYKEPYVDPSNAEKYIKTLNEAQALKFAFLKHPNLIIQSEKVIIQDIDWKESPAIINNFKKNLEKNRSEFRFLPDEDKVEKEFDEDAFTLRYNDSVNKLRSIKELREDKYGASKYLAGKIFAASLSNEKPDKKTTTQILTFFKGLTSLSFHTLWEKAATYFVINEQIDSLTKFYSQSLYAIRNIEYDLYEDPTFRNEIRNLLTENLNEYLTIAIATPLAFNPQLSKRVTHFKDAFKTISADAKSIRSSNMFRHAWIGLPAINYTNYLFENDLENNLLKIGKVNGNAFGLTPMEYFQLNTRLTILSPRYVHFHELNVLEIHKSVNSISEVSQDAIDLINEIPNRAYNNYWELNHRWKFPDVEDQKIASLILASSKEYFEINSLSGRFDDVNSANIISVKNYNQDTEINKKVAIANIKVDSKNVEGSYLGNPNTSRERRQELFKLINQVEEARCDLFVLPEVSVPYQWLNLLAYQSQRRNIAIVAGLEHWVNKFNFAFNFMVTILPINRQNYRTCLVRIRLKNHYSPEEKRQLRGYRLVVPTDVTPRLAKRYDLFHWNKSYFSVYNCFELADIQDRALFKGKVDLIIASEYNQDITYFSDIAGSWVRDIHCFFIQVNSSDYGDSRVLQPSQTITKNILQIKGGDNSTIIVGKLPIKELRAFQLKEYELQKDDKTFKPSPPDFNREDVQARIENKNPS
ncbi:MAG: hypothetical protein K9G42_12265 [Pedobacter sp.]|nr:hypothetical protein [Pedobacter sp.]